MRLLKNLFSRVEENNSTVGTGECNNVKTLNKVQNGDISTEYKDAYSVLKSFLVNSYKSKTSRLQVPEIACNGSLDNKLDVVIFLMDVENCNLILSRYGVSTVIVRVRGYY